MSERASLPWRLLGLLLAFVSGFSVWSPQAQTKKPAPQYRITGIVVNAQDGSPVAGSRMSAAAVTEERRNNRDAVQTFSDDRGRFALDLPSEGRWRLIATAPTFHTQAFDEHASFSSSIILTPTQPAYDLVFRVNPDAVLSGTVLDEAGEAARNASVSLLGIDRTATTAGSSPVSVREGTQTDDRGHYEFAGLAPGDYMVNVQTRPWYANQDAPASSNGTLDPPLDLVYPITWYPGVIDDSAAGTLTAHPGDRLVANFNLLPAPSAHLRVASGSSGSSRASDTRPSPCRGNCSTVAAGPDVPTVSLLLPHGVVVPTMGSSSVDPSGALDLGGLAPGIYQVTRSALAAGDPARTSIVRIGIGGSVTEAGAGTSGSAVTLSLDGDAQADPTQVSLVDTVTGRAVNSAGRFRGSPLGNRGPAFDDDFRDGPESAAGGPGRRGRSAESDTKVTLNVPPGRYEVRLPRRFGFVAELSVSGAATATGRFLTLRSGNAQVTVHVSSALASVDGFATVHSKPSIGAMVLLVPATLGDPSGLTLVRRDQTDTDGGFHLTQVIPGQYILIAIDHGWTVNWNDPATLRPYLMQGTPLDLALSRDAHPRIEAQTP